MATVLDEVHEARRREVQALIDAAPFDGSQAAFAVATGIAPSYVTRMLKLTSDSTRKNIGDDMALRIEQALRLAPGRLLHPRGVERGNVTEIEPRRRVPLISWVCAGRLEEVREPESSYDWQDVYTTKPGEHAFALRVDGDSMTSPYPNEQSFPDGTILIVDPSRNAGAGDYVVAKDVTTQRATFKKLATDGGRWFLKPLNPAYPTVEIDDPALRVIGRVIEWRRGGKL